MTAPFIDLSEQQLPLCKTVFQKGASWKEWRMSTKTQQASPKNRPEEECHWASGRFSQDKILKKKHKFDLLRIQLTIPQTSRSCTLAQTTFKDPSTNLKLAVDEQSPAPGPDFSHGHPRFQSGCRGAKIHTCPSKT